MKVILLLSLLFVLSYRHRGDRKEWLATAVCVLGFAVALIASALLPCDILMVSFMKDEHGHFKDWANTTEKRNELTDAMLYTYYGLYCLVAFLIFLLLPLAYFYYEEGGEDRAIVARCGSALKFSLFFLFGAAVIFIIGALVPFRGAPIPNNGTEWEQIKNLFAELNHVDRWEQSLAFTVSLLSLLGWFVLVPYTGYGLTVWPLSLLMGMRSMSSEQAEMMRRQASIQEEIEAIHARRDSPRRSDARRLERLQDDLELTARDLNSLQDVQGRCWRRCYCLVRPLEVFFALLFYGLVILVFVSLLMTNIDKLLHWLGFRMGYMLPERRLPNPIDITLLHAQWAFPMDFLLVVGLLFFLVTSSIQAFKYLGVRLCCIQLYTIRWRRTRAQALLLLSWCLTLLVLALDLLLFQVAPQYVLYGNQHWVNSTVNGTSHVVSCSTKAPASECTVSCIGRLITQLCYRFWFIAAAYYWTSWAFLVVILVGFVVGLVCYRRSNVQRAEVDDLYDSDEEPLNP